MEKKLATMIDVYRRLLQGSFRNNESWCSDSGQTLWLSEEVPARYKDKAEWNCQSRNALAFAWKSKAQLDAVEPACRLWEWTALIWSMPLGRQLYSSGHLQHLSELAWMSSANYEGVGEVIALKFPTPSDMGSCWRKWPQGLDEGSYAAFKGKHKRWLVIWWMGFL